MRAEQHRTINEFPSHGEGGEPDVETILYQPMDVDYASGSMVYTISEQDMEKLIPFITIRFEIRLALKSPIFQPVSMSLYDWCCIRSLCLCFVL